MKRIGIILITKNRYLSVKEYILNILFECEKYNIDIIIIDSSKNELVNNFIAKCRSSNLLYINYIEDENILSIDDKVIWAIEKYMFEYEYILFSSDGIIPNIKKLIHEIKEETVDILIYDNGIKRLEKYIYDPKILLKEFCWRMTSLSSTIVSTKLLNRSIIFYKSNKKDGLGFWIPMIYFYYYAYTNKCFVKYVEGNFLWKKNKYIEPSFWLVSGNLLWQWGKVWVESVEALPEMYTKEKNKTILSHDENMKLFSLMKLISVQEWGNISVFKIRKYRKYINKVTNTKIWCFYFVCIFYKSKFIKIFKYIIKKIIKEK